MNDEDARLTPDEEQELIGAVLRRTSGGACGQAEELLAGVEDRAPSDDDHALLESHLEHCPACAALARNLAVARDTLPSLASIDPGPSFTAAVLAVTSRAAPATVAERLGAWWTAWQARPRFALEAAYVATLVILLVAGNPAATLQAASARTVSVASAGLERAREVWPVAVRRVAPAAIELPASVRSLGGATSEVIARGRASGIGLGGAWDRALAQWSIAWGWLRDVATDLAGRISGTVTSIRAAVGQWINRPATEPRAPGAR